MVTTNVSVHCSLREGEVLSVWLLGEKMDSKRFKNQFN